jgi:hypothetical protein
MKLPRLKERKKEIKFPAFRFEAKVVLTNDIKRSRAKIDSVIGCPGGSGDEPDGLCTEYKPGFKFFLFFHHGADVDTIVHECWHGVFFMLNTLGIAVDHETTANCLGYLSQQVFDFVHRKGES